MSTPLRQKKLKVELTFTVSMDEIDPELSNPSLAQQLQQALLNDENALTRLMISVLLNKLQGYADYLAAQDDLASLKKVAQALESEEPEQLISAEPDFAQETRPLRISCMKIHMDSSSIQERVNSDAGECQWQTVWRDLRPDSKLGLLFEGLAIPTSPIPYAHHRDSGHSLRIRYLTQQTDGIHIAGRCTCQEPFEGIGMDESLALDDLWSHYKPHREASSLASKFQARWKTRLMPGKQ